MKKRLEMKFKRILSVSMIVFIFLMLTWKAAAQPIKQDNTNPHYFNYKGKPTILLTSDHAYGALLFKKFDYRKFLQTLSSNGMNFTRVYPGAVPPPWFAWPADIYPWAKTANGKYDLNKWNPEYFKRLKDFVEYAFKKDIIVDICFFNGTGNFLNPEHPHHPNHVYEEFPLYPSNNIQGIGVIDCRKFNILGNNALNKIQIEYVKKITSFLKDYDNILFDIADEPDAKVEPKDFTPWVDKMLQTVVDVDKNKHLVSVCNAGAICKQYNFVGDKRTSWVSMEYLEGLNKLSTDYKFNKPLTLIESCTFCSDTTDQRLQYVGDAISDSRVEAWEYLVGGAAGFMQFNFDYSRPFFNPGLINTKSNELFVQKRVLKDFMNSFDFVKMASDTFGINKSGTFAKGITERGQQYAFYMHHSTKEHRYFWGSYMVVPGDYKNEPVTFYNMPSGIYKIEWINPKDGKSALTPYILIHGGGSLILYTPSYNIDIALRIKNVQNSSTTLLYGKTNRPSMSTFIRNEKVDLHFKWSNLDKPDTLNIEISNEKNQIIWATNTPVNSGSDSIVVSSPSDKYGYYRASASFRMNGTSLPAIGTRGSGYLTYCVVPDPAKRIIYPDTLSRFGLQGATRSTIPYLGVRWVLANGYGWQLEEPDSAGQFLHKRHDSIRKNIQYPINEPVIYNNNPWTVYSLPTFGSWMNKWAVIPGTLNYSTGALNVENEKDWVNYCKAATKAFMENFPDMTRRVYQITWEPVIPWGFKGTPKQLARIYELCYQTIHNMDSKAEVVGPTLGENNGITNNILKQTQDFLYAGGRNFIDGISMHPYCQIPTWDPDLRNGLRNLMKNVVKPAQSRITRFYGTEHGSKILIKGNYLDELNQARMLILENITMLGEGAQFNFSFYGYDWLTANEGHPENEEGYMGYYYNLSSKPWAPDDISPKPAASAYAASSFLLEGHVSRGPITNLRDNTFGYNFSKSDGSDIVLVLWNIYENQDITLNVGDVKSVNVIDWMGNSISKKVSNGLIAITVGKEPVYIKGVNTNLL